MPSALNSSALNQHALNADGSSTGALAATEASDVFAGAAQNIANAALAATEANDTLAATAKHVATGVLVATEAADVFAAVAKSKDCRHPEPEYRLRLPARAYTLSIPGRTMRGRADARCYGVRIPDLRGAV